MQIGEIEQLLPSDKFARTHRSYIVAIDKIEAYSSSQLDIENHQIPIGRTYRNSLLQKLEKL